MKKSVLQLARMDYLPKMPSVLESPVKAICGQPTQSAGDHEQIKKLFPNTYGLPEITFAPADVAPKTEPLNVGVILSGGQAPGGHNVICGLYDGIKKVNHGSRLFGFLMGPQGLVDHNYKELTGKVVEEYRNTGGFDIIGSGRTKLETKEQFDRGLEILLQLNIRALVIIGGDDSNTNAAVLAEYYKSIGAPVQVIGVPKTIDGDLKNDVIEASFGFDTATKVYSELIGNIQRDCYSSRKYWHFIKLMGRSASHIALECALQCQPNICVISEELEARNMTLQNVVNNMADVIAHRAAQGRNFGSVLVPEGLIEFVPTIKALIGELNDMLAANAKEFAALHEDDQYDWILRHLSKDAATTFQTLPRKVAMQLSLDRDPHGNVQVSLVETEKLLSEMVRKRLHVMREEGRYNGKFAAMHHFFGYEGRCSDPSNFDADYCYTLGHTAACLAASGVTGYMAAVRHLTLPAAQWIPGGVPITMLMNVERRRGQPKPVIRKALVDLKGRPFQEYAIHRHKWALETSYVYPGPLQFFGPADICDQPTLTLQLEHPTE